MGSKGRLRRVPANAQAQTTTCNTDKDCPGTACGSQVCHKSSGSSTCVDANTAGVSGFDDGWCSDNGTAVDSNCKCASLGATCTGLNCTFTVPPDGGAGGSGTGTSGGGGCSVAGAPSFGSAAFVALFAAALMRRRV